MKTRYYIPAMLILLLSIMPAISVFAVKHIINVQNYTFSPASITNVQVGDTMRWVWVSGNHTTTSTTIPAGAATWDHLINSTSTSYEYKVQVSGTYNYQCTPHAAMGMVGSFVVVGSTPTLSVTPANQNVNASSGSVNFNVVSNSAWTASSNNSWCTVTPSGTGNGVITATYSANPSVNQRVATITVTVAGLPAQTSTVTQAGAAATLSVSPPNQNVSSAAGSTSFSVTSNTNWTTSSNAAWCTVTPAGAGNGSITATFSANAAVSPRVATVSVTATGVPVQTVTVTQAGAAPILVVTPPNQNVGETGGVTSFTITSNTSWTAVCDSAWCVVTPSGTGNSQLSASYESNIYRSARFATITVTADGLSPQVVTVTQSASTVGIADSPKAAIFSVYPNPSTGVFNIVPGTFAGNSFKLSVTDQLGNMVMERKFESGDDWKFDLAGESSGIYLLRMEDRKSVILKKVVVAR